MSDKDVSHVLGRCQMPQGYKLIQLDSGHFMWHHERSDDESSIHWNKWAVYHGAHADNKERSKP